MPKGEAQSRVAKKAAKLVKAGRNVQKNRKVWRTVTFHRKKPLALPRSPKLLRKSNVKHVTKDKYSTIAYPLSTETAMRCIEEQNTLVFIVNLKASKPMIKRAFFQLYGKKPMKVNTLVRPDGLKKAFIKLSPEEEAADVASKIGIM